MRPGSLLTVRVDGEDYALLFLHVASWPDAGGFGLRANMIERAFKFRKTLDQAARKPANYLFLGDLNSMGLDYEYGKVGRSVQHARVSAEQEISRLSYLASKHSMRLATKNADVTWGNPGRPSMRSNLDHVVVAEHLRFVQFDGADVDVRGWPKLPTGDQADWMRNYSDHGLLYFEVEKD